MPARLVLCLMLLSSTVAVAEQPPEVPSMEFLEFLAGPEAADEAWWEDAEDSSEVSEDDEGVQRYEVEPE